MLLNTWGALNSWEEDTTGGGGGWQRHKKPKKDKKDKKKLVNRYYDDEKYELGDEKYLAPEFIKKVEEGKIEVAGVEVYLQEPIKVPPLEFKPSIQIDQIKDEIEREIAQIMRADELLRIEAQKEAYIKEMRELEEMVLLTVFLLLDEE